MAKIYANYCKAILFCLATYLFPTSVLAQNMGFEAPAAIPPTGWVPVTLTWSHNTNSNFVRTGGNSMTVTDPATSGSTIGSTNGFVTTAAAGNYLVTIAWGKSNTAANASFYLGYRSGTTNNLNPATTTTPAAQYVLNNTSWTRITSASAATVAAGTYGPALRAFRQASTTGTILYMDDFIIYASPSNVPDLTAPNPATGASVVSNNLSWTNGTDNGAPASGISGVVIMRADGPSLAPPTLNNQGMYNTVNGTAGTGSFTDGANTWTVVANIAGSSTTNFTDASAGPGPYTYAIYMRDMAYNYSTGTTVTVASPCTNPVTAGSFYSSVSTPVCPGSPVTISLTGGTGGIGQTFQWQLSSTLGGTYTNLGGLQNSSAMLINPTSTFYYRAEITCSGGTPVYSTPAQVLVNTGFSGTYTINSALSTGGNNYQTFAAAINAMTSCGITGPVIFNVEAGSGPYNEQVTIPSISGASATNTVTFNGNATTLSFAGTSSLPYTLGFDGADFITVNNLIVQGTDATNALACHLWNGADNNTFSNCTFIASTSATGTLHSPFSISGTALTAIATGNSGSNNTITGCTLTGGYYGLSFSGSTANTGNKAINNTINDFHYYGIYQAYCNNTVLKGNTIERPGRTNSSTTVYGIYLTTSTANCVVDGNQLKNFFGGFPAGTSTVYGIAGVSTTVGNENRIINNLITGISSLSGIAYGLYGQAHNYNLFYHNTVVLDNATSTAGATYAFYGYGTGLELKNNILYVTRSGTGVKYCIYMSAVGTSASNNNVLHMNAPAGTNNIGYFSAAFATLTAWQGANSGAWDQQSSDADPIFLNPGAGDYMPTNSIVNNLGAPVGVLTDIIGAARSTASPDPGAYEFNVVGLDAGISWVSPTSPSTTGSKAIIVNIANTQTVTVTSVQLSYSDGGTPVTQTFTGLNITAGNNQNLSFTTPYNLTGTKTMTARILSVNGITDNVAANNMVDYYLCLPLSGTYTINSTSATGGINFQSFTDAVAALSCGISAPVIFDVAAGSGPYNEQVTIPEINGASSTNTITINGNGTTISYTANVGAPYTVGLNGADFFTFNNLVVEGTDATYSLTCHLWNAADSNTFNGCTFVASSSATGTVHSPFSISGSATTAIATGNSGSFNTVTGCTLIGGYYGLSLSGSTANTGNKAINNTINDFYYYGIYQAYCNNTVLKGNTIERPTRGNSNATVYGINLTTSTANCLVDGNQLKNFFGGFSAGTSTVYGISGIATTVGNENRITNNLITGISSLSGIVYGLYGQAYNYNLFYHNTVALDNTNSTAGATYAFYGYGTGLELKNNILSVTRAGTGVKYCIYMSSTGTSVSNNNVLHMNAPAGTNNIGYFSTAFATLIAWQGANSSAWDQQSLDVDPTFTNAAGGDFTPTNGYMDNLGTNVGVTKDILGNTRSTTTPDAGAYEFTPLFDVVPPMITYTKIVSTSSTANRTLTATITDQSGVQQGVNGPRLYYKKSTSSTYVFDASPTRVGNNYTFTIDHAAIGGVSQGTIIEYYVAAQDSAASPNTATNPSGGAGFNPPGVSPPTAPNSYVIVPILTGTYLVGTGETYEKLTNIANAINNNLVEIGGNVTFEFTSNYDGTTGEILPINFNEFISSNPNYTVTIRPGAGVTSRVTSGDPGTGVGVSVINFTGGDRYIFDGRPGGVGTANEWTIRNTRTATTIGSVIRFVDDATNNVIRNLNIESQATSTTTGAVFFNTSTGTIGNSFNTISNNHIRGISGLSISNGVYSNGSAAVLNSDNAIVNNHIYNFGTAGISLTATGNGPNWTINNNHLYNTISSALTQNGIAMASATTLNSTINGNFIGGNAPNAAGVWTNTGNVIVTGIAFSNGVATMNGNTIANITSTGTGTTARIRGIYHTSPFDSISISNNTLYNLSSTGTLGTGYTAGNQVACGISVWPGSTFYVTHLTGNTIYNISAETTTAIATTNMAAGVFLTNFRGVFEKNKIYDIKNKSTGTVANQPPIATGIYSRFFGDGYVINNMISVGSNENTNTQFSGIVVAGAGTTGNREFYHNNSVVVTGTSGGSTSSYAFIRGDHTSTTPGMNINAKNNIFFVDRTGGGSVNYVLANQGTAASTDWSSDTNILYNSITSNIGYWNNAGYDLAGWKTASGGSGFSKSVLVNFVNLSMADLHLTGSSIADPQLAGRPMTEVTDDFDGDTRNANNPYIGADEAIVPLPVKMYYFTGKRQANEHILSWKVDCSSNMNFLVERSVDARSFSSIGNVNALQSDCRAPFTFSDKDPMEGMNYYRLRIVEPNGTYTYSGIVALINRNSGFEIVSLQPTLVDGSITQLNLTATRNTTVGITITDVTGRIVAQIQKSVTAGSSLIPVDVSKLSKGVYQLTGKTNDGYEKTIRFVKQ